VHGRHRAGETARTLEPNRRSLEFAHAFWVDHYRRCVGQAKAHRSRRPRRRARARPHERALSRDPPASLRGAADRRG
jgi:hypothetical protein